MALPFSRPDPTSPADVAKATFSTARRGYDADEVRDVLKAVAAELGRLQERERFLERELRSAQAEAGDASSVLDDDTVTRLLGEETVRVLRTARESASQIRIKAEEGAARILQEAADEAKRLREEAEVEAARKRHDAAADAEAEVSLAKQQGREMVNEARAYRERVLSELARRREAARQQIEQLIHGRDRLLQVFERARLVAVDVVSDLTPLREPDEYVDLSPTTGPVPMMTPASRPSGDRVSSDVRPIDETTNAVDHHERDAVEAPTADAVVDAEVVADEAPTDAVSTDVEVQDEEIEPEPEAEDARGDEAEPVDVEPVESDESGNVVALFPDGSADKRDVDGLFARLRADAGAGGDTAAVSDAGGPASDAATTDADAANGAAAAADTIFARRDADLVPLIVAAARKLKRVLADEQNSVLETLRGKAFVDTIDALLPELHEHADRYSDAIADELLGAARAGAELVGAGDVAVAIASPAVLDGARGWLRSDLVSPLRDRLARAVSEGSGDNDDIARRVRAVYREWKVQHINDQLDDVFRIAHGAGVLAAVKPGTPMCWMVDPDGPACPDAEDNSLAGAVEAGKPYPTGHVVAPAHAGCRCLLAASRR